MNSFDKKKYLAVKNSYTYNHNSLLLWLGIISEELFSDFVSWQSQFRWDYENYELRIEKRRRARAKSIPDAPKHIKPTKPRS